MRRPVKGVTTSLTLWSKIPNKKQKARFSITDITHQDLSKLNKKFNNSPFISYKSKQIHNERTEAYLLLIKKITNIVKI